MSPFRAELIPALWARLEACKPGDAGILQSASVVAFYDTDDPKWVGVAEKVASALVTSSPVSLGEWLEVLRPVWSPTRLSRLPRSFRTAIARSPSRS